jgi:hypothetical protein
MGRRKRRTAAAMTDGEAVRIARRIQRMQWEINALLAEIRNNHPNGRQIYDDMVANEVETMAWPEHVVRHALLHPERWVIGDFGIRYVGRGAEEA